MHQPTAIDAPGAPVTGKPNWTRLAARSRTVRYAEAASIYGFLIAVSFPVILPYFWLVMVAFSARRGIAETDVLWRAVAILVPGIVVSSLILVMTTSRRLRLAGLVGVTAM